MTSVQWQSDSVAINFNKLNNKICNISSSGEVSPEEGCRCSWNVVFILSICDNGKSSCECCWYHLCKTIVRNLSVILNL